MSEVVQDTPSQLTGIVRNVLSAAGGFIVAHGYTDAATLQQLGGAALPVIAAVWGWYEKRQTAKKIATLPTAQGGTR